MKKLIILFLSIFCFLNGCVIAKEKILMINDTPGIYIFKIDTKKYGEKIKPYITQNLTVPSKVYEENCFELVVNAGFFDVKTGKSVSYVTIDNEMVADVEENTALTESLKKENRLEYVLQRGELRILQKGEELKFDIALHNAPIEEGYTLKHALQAGPILFPNMDLVKEGFVIYDENCNVKFQAADILKRRERTAIALKGKYLYIVIFTKENKVDVHEMATFMKKTLKAKKALAFDGGLSTAINYKNISIGSLGKQQRRVKSFLVIER